MPKPNNENIEFTPASASVCHQAIDTAERDRAVAELESERKRRTAVERQMLDFRVRLETEMGNSAKLRCPSGF